MNKLLIILLLFFAVDIYAQDTQLFKADSIKRVVEGTQINTHIRIDGVLNDPQWSRAKQVSDFIQIEPSQGERAIHRTELGILYNNQYLYLGVYCQDSLGKRSIRATDFKRDFDFKQHDLITVAIDAFNDNRNSMAFVTNPYGVQRDLLAYDILRMNYAGLLTNLNPPPPKPNIRIQPYFLTSYDSYTNHNNPELATEYNYQAGGELKWAITPNSVLDLTVNTDFAQADVDHQVNNLTRFSVFFPEKRQFFLENSSLFGISGSPRPGGTGGHMRIQPFFSRRIGLDELGNPIPISAGARYVHRSAKHNYGVMAMRQRELEDSPATNFLIGRYAENFGKQNRVGGLFVMKNSEYGTHFTNVLDGFFRLGQAHSINSLITHTISSEAHDDGFAAYVQYYYSTNQWKAWWTQSVVSEQFNPEMGFVSRSDIIGTTPGFIWQYRGSKLPYKDKIRAFEPGINGEFYHQTSSGELLERQINIRPFYLNLQSGAYIGYNLQIQYQNLVSSFAPLGVIISEGDYQYNRHQLLLSSDPSKMFNFSADLSWGNYFDGSLQSYTILAQFVPIPHISLHFGIDRNYFDKVGLEEVTKRVDLFSIEGRFAINPRLQLVGFYQQNSEFNSMNYNIRFSWEYKPLSFIYLIINRRGFDNLQHIRQTEDHIIAKINFLKQF
jgi:hypothetical protein